MTSALVPDMTQEYPDYIETNQPLVEFFIKAHQCSGLSISSLRKWLSNFPDVKGKYFAVRMLKHFLFYSDSDVLRLLRFGLDYFVREKKARQEMLKSGFVQMPSLLTPLLQQEMDNTVFIPLLNDNKPTESGEEIIRLLSKKVAVSERNCMFHWNLTDEILKKMTRIVIVDDNIGSGDQLEDFWTHPSSLSYGDFRNLSMKMRHLHQEFSVAMDHYFLVPVY